MEFRHTYLISGRKNIGRGIREQIRSLKAGDGKEKTGTRESNSDPVQKKEPERQDETQLRKIR